MITLEQAIFAATLARALRDKAISPLADAAKSVHAYRRMIADESFNQRTLHELWPGTPYDPYLENEQARAQMRSSEEVLMVATAMWNAFDGVAQHFSELKQNQRDQWLDMAVAAIAALRKVGRLNV